MSNFFRGLFLLLFCGIGYSCSTNITHSETVTFVNEKWKTTESAEFTIPVTDTTEYYKLNFLLRHTSAYPYSNIFLLVTATSPDGSCIKDTVEYLLSDIYGKWIGDKGSNFWNCELQYRKEIRFSEQGNYQISVLHGMRTNILEGISNVSLVLYKEEDNGQE